MKDAVEVEVEWEGKNYTLTLERGYHYENSDNPTEARKSGSKYDYEAAVYQDVEEAVFFHLDYEGDYAQRILDEDYSVEEDMLEEAQEAVGYDSYFGNEEDAAIALIGNNSLVKEAKNEVGMEADNPEGRDCIVRNLLAYKIVPSIISELRDEMIEKIEEQSDSDPEQENEEASTR